LNILFAPPCNQSTSPTSDSEQDVQERDTFNLAEKERDCRNIKHEREKKRAGCIPAEPWRLRQEDANERQPKHTARYRSFHVLSLSLLGCLRLRFLTATRTMGFWPWFKDERVQPFDSFKVRKESRKAISQIDAPVLQHRR